jgi:hypothetical protein
MKTNSKQRDLASFKSLHDPSIRYINKITAGLASLAGEGKEAWENEGEFIRRCGMAVHTFSGLRDQFKEYWVYIPRSGTSQVKRAWFADKRIAAKARS